MTPQPRGGQVGADGKVLGVLEEALKRRSLLRLGSPDGPTGANLNHALKDRDMVQSTTIGAGPP